MRADPSQEREASAGMSWVLVEVAPAQIAVWPERSPEGRAALKGTDRTIIVIPRSQVVAREDTERPEDDEGLRPVMLCKLCRAGAGGECHMPGCGLYGNRAPDIPVRDGTDD